jgi:hypothetical protein
MQGGDMDSEDHIGSRNLEPGDRDSSVG